VKTALTASLPRLMLAQIGPALSLAAVGVGLVADFFIAPRRRSAGVGSKKIAPDREAL
jgi:hypothetical protein